MKGCSVGECSVLCKMGSGGFSHPHAWIPVPAHSVPRASRGVGGGNPLSLKSDYQTQLSASGLLSLEALHLPQPRGGVRMGLDGRETGF